MGAAVVGSPLLARALSPERTGCLEWGLPGAPLRVPLKVAVQVTIRALLGLRVWGAGSSFVRSPVEAEGQKDLIESAAS